MLRIGHLERPIPDGYLETLMTGENQLQDRNLAAYYDKLRLVTRGPLFSWERLKTIVEMNLGKYDHLIDKDFYRSRLPDAFALS
jgi:arabinofuranosyltransferase